MSAPPFASPAVGPDAPKWHLAHVLRATVGRLILAAYRTRFVDTDNLPATGGFVLAGNHVSHLDPVLLWCGSPRPTHFIAKQELFDVAPLGWLLSRVWVFPIHRGTADRESIQRATELLKRGEPVGIFPEGTRQDAGVQLGDAPAEAHSGVAFIAMRAGVPVVPVGISGTDLALPRGAKFPRFPRVTIRIGVPVRPEDFVDGGRKERMTAMTAEIMRRISDARTATEKG